MRPVVRGSQECADPDALRNEAELALVGCASTASKDDCASQRVLAAALPMPTALLLPTHLADEDLVSSEDLCLLPKPYRRGRLYGCLLELTQPMCVPRRSHTAPAARSRLPKFRARVLLAEDNPVNRDLATIMLEQLGCRTVVAENGQEAVNAFARESFDIVLMDGEMPIMDGIEASRRIHGLNRQRGAPKVPVVAVTAHALAQDRERYLGAGLDDYLSKPYSKRQLAGLLGRWLTPAQDPAPDAQPPTQMGDQTMHSHRDTDPLTHPATDPPLIEPKALESIRSLRPGQGDRIVAKVIRLFLDTAPGQIQAARHALESGDRGGLKSYAHSLKSSSANVGAARLSAVAKRLEAMAGGDAPVSEEDVRELEEVFAAVTPLLTEEMQRAEASEGRKEATG
jgi:CheY-like chemotaxis protein